MGLIGKARLQESLPVGKEVIIKTEKTDSFGRWLADVDLKGQSLSRVLSEQGYGIYKENKKKGE